MVELQRALVRNFLLPLLIPLGYLKWRDRFAKSKYQIDTIMFVLLLILVWKSEQWERHLIIKTIAEYVLIRHLSLRKENITHIVDQLDFSLVHGTIGNNPYFLLLIYFRFLSLLLCI